MRILIFTLQFPPAVGGVEIAAWRLSKNLSQTGNKIFVLTGMAKEAEPFDLQQDFLIRRIPLGSTNNPFTQVYQKINLIFQFVRMFKDTKPDRILCMHWDPCAYIARGALSMMPHPPPYYVITHGMELFQLPRSFPMRWMKARLRSFALTGARKIFSVSAYTRDQVISLGVRIERTKVIPNGIEWEDRSQLPAGDAKRESLKILLTISRLVPRKGHDTVLCALTKVITQVPEVVYKIAGAGPEEIRLKYLTEELGLSARVQFLGAVSDDEKQRLLAECDIFVLPCRATATDFEGFGIALLEAMQYGKPVIAGRSGGVPDIVQDGQTGVLVPPDDPDALAREVIALLRDPETGERLGENARQRARDHYGWDLIAEKYLAEMKA